MPDISMPETSVPDAFAPETLSIFGTDPDTKWRIIDDGVMGGKSHSSYTAVDNYIAYQGTLNLNGGGFCTI